MMTCADEWRALSSRIRSLMDAGRLHAGVRDGDSDVGNRYILEQSRDVLTLIEQFGHQFQQYLSPAAVASVDRFVSGSSRLIREDKTNPEGKRAQVWAALVSLAAFESELSYLLSDVQEWLKTRSERAFAHLQRLIVVDAAVRGQWCTAYDKGEVECEKLGAVHLLSHGIWAFKLHAKGARTDLVYQDSVIDLAGVQRYAEGLVLTEWKVAKPDGEAEQRFSDARGQARRYALGALAATDLTSYRYAVVVSRRAVAVPEDYREDAVVYRHVNIAVEPVTPSKSSA